MSGTSQNVTLSQLDHWISALVGQLTAITESMPRYQTRLEIYRNDFPKSFDYKMGKIGEFSGLIATYQNRLSNIQNRAPKKLCDSVEAIEQEVSKIQAAFDTWVESQESDDPPPEPQRKRRGWYC